VRSRDVRLEFSESASSRGFPLKGGNAPFENVKRFSLLLGSVPRRISPLASDLPRVNTATLALRARYDLVGGNLSAGNARREIYLARGYARGRLCLTDRAGMALLLSSFRIYYCCDERGRGSLRAVFIIGREGHSRRHSY